MSTVHHSSTLDRHTGGPTRGPGRDDGRRPGHYLTDGTDLYRLVDVAAESDAPATVWIENCLTLETVLATVEELRGWGLRSVSPRSAG